MAQITVVTLTCDKCGTENEVEEHIVQVDGKAAISVDACTRCWDRASTKFFDLLNQGRSAKRAAKKRANAGV